MDCIFCKIVAGELPSHKVYENERVLAFLDIHPVHPGHTLVIPKVHARNLLEIAAEDWAAVAEAARMLAIAVEKATDADGMNIMMNNRAHAGQVVDHAHVHVIPRFKGDGLRQWSPRSYKENEAAEIEAKIREAL
ncbi:MAG: HIT family protein [Candidatus Kaiserbacteria bacterium]|nr:HIT family protein [Candidatus Kaiserbacteria bacterium]